MLVVAFALIVVLAIENLLIPIIKSTNVNAEQREQILSNVSLVLMLSEELEVPLDMQVIQSLRQEIIISFQKMNRELLPISAKIRQKCLKSPILI